jgi:ADP-ribose pyrophosphatase YjhB (NUDIX family)
MKLLRTIRDGDVGSDMPDSVPTQERETSRAVVFDADGKVALFHATKKNFHKLPGGGIEQGEDIETALRRELMEEIGCSVKNLQELGSVEEYRNEGGMHQISYCFLANVDGEKGAPHLEENEIAAGFETVWVGLEDAIKILESEAPVEAYEGKFMQLRDVTFLKEAQAKR